MTRLLIPGPGGGGGGGGLTGTYHDVTGSRAIGTVYTNAQPVAIWLAIIVSSVGGAIPTITVNGSIFPFQGTCQAGSELMVMAWVPAGDTYELTNAGGADLSFSFWYEFY